MNSSRNPDTQGRKSTGAAAAPVSLKRRSLVKGFAAATPGIFTLYSGNAQAMLSNKQCTTQSQAVFTGEQAQAGEEQMVDGFVRLARGPGVHVVHGPGKSAEAPGITGQVPPGSGAALSNVPGAAPGKPGVALSNFGLAPGQAVRKDKWLVMIPDSAGVSHYVEASHVAATTGYNAESGTSWNEFLAGKEWLPTEDSGAGVPGSPLKLVDPDSDPSDPDIYVQDFLEAKTIQVLACVDDSGNIVSAYPQDCEALGLSPPSGSCWASSMSTEETMNTWWG
jgi:hypothetical protein